MKDRLCRTESWCQCCSCSCCCFRDCPSPSRRCVPVPLPNVLLVHIYPDVVVFISKATHHPERAHARSQYIAPTVLYVSFSAIAFVARYSCRYKLSPYISHTPCVLGRSLPLPLYVIIVYLWYGAHSVISVCLEILPFGL